MGLVGVCLTTVFDKNFPGSEAFGEYTDGKSLVYCLARLDDLARQCSVTPISGFAPDYEDMADDYEGPPIEEQWFDAAEGLHSVSAIIEATSGSTEWARGLAKLEAEEVLDCLRSLERVLAAGKEARARFYLLYC